MFKKDLVEAVTARLIDEGVRKPIRVQRHTFYITDSDGNKAEFEIGRRDVEYAFTKKDVESILNAMMDIIVETIQRGEPIAVKGFGVLHLHYRAPRWTRRPDTGEIVEVEERLVPKFEFGSRLRIAARAFELIRDDKDAAPKLPEPIYDEEDDFGDEDIEGYEYDDERFDSNVLYGEVANDGPVITDVKA